MTPEEIEAFGIAHSSSVKILQKAREGGKVTLKEFLMLYIDDMESDDTLIDWCNTERERSLAYAIIALNTRIMNKVDPMAMYDLMLQHKPRTMEQFDAIKIQLNADGYGPMSEEEEKELEDAKRQAEEFMKENPNYSI